MPIPGGRWKLKKGRARADKQCGMVGSVSGAQLSVVQLMQVAKLAATDRHVRAHEQAHLAAAGPYARGGPSYSYARGPDGQIYAVGGEVSLDTSPVEGDPEATLQKAKTIQAAANAPADPSSQDRQVAAAAAVMEQAAAQEIALKRAYAGRPEAQRGSLVDLQA